jgi:hypothetical protein
MRLIFLDIDGVLNHEQWFRNRGRAPMDLTYRQRLQHSVDPHRLELLNQITDLTGAKIVLSSSWRNYASWQTTARGLAEHGMRGMMVDATPRKDERDHRVFARFQGRFPDPIEPYPRGYEIQQWLDPLPVAPQFVILDDDPDMEHLGPRLVQTSFETGLTEEHVNEAIRLLS